MKPPILASSAFFLFAMPALMGAQNPDEGKVTAASLPKMLKDLGYEPEKVGDSIQRVSLTRNKFTFQVSISPSGNGRRLWMTCYLVDMTDPAKVPASTLAEALKSNNDTGPAHLMLVKIENKYWLEMGYALDNRGITPGLLRTDIDWFIDRLTECAPVWDKSKWGAKG